MPYGDYIRETPDGFIRVVSSADYDSIVSYTPLPDIVVYTDAVVNLPNTVQATFKSGKIETMVIKWERINVDTSTAGNKKIYGDIGNGAAAVLQNVIVNELSDLDILRQIRDANPSSQLPTLWLDSEDPYTQWEGVQYVGNKLIQLNINELNIINLPKINKLKHIETINANGNPIDSVDLSGSSTIVNFNCSSGYAMNYLNISNCPKLKQVTCNYQKLSNVIITNSPIIETLYLGVNLLVSIPSLTSKGLINSYDFRNNKMNTTETTRIINLGFDSAFVLPQNL